LIEESKRNNREGAEQDRVKGGPYSLPVEIIHRISIQTRSSAFSNTTVTSTRFKEFPFVLKAIPSSPGKEFFDTEFICPECGSRLKLFATQKTCVILTPDDFLSSDYRRDLCRSFVKRRMTLAGLLWSPLLLLPSLIAGEALSIMVGHGSWNDRFLSGPLGVCLGLALWIAVVSIVLGTTAFRNRNGPQETSLFILRGTRSVLWRCVDHSRFFNLITSVRLAQLSFRKGTDDSPLVDRHSVNCKYREPNSSCPGSFSDSELKGNYARLYFDRSYVL
jgi:hypothetical protein